MATILTQGERTYARVLDNRGGKQEEYLDLLDLARVIDEFWSEEEFRALEKVLKPKNRAARVSWIEQLNEARRVIAHPLRGDLSSQQLDSLCIAEDVIDRWLAAD